MQMTSRGKNDKYLSCKSYNGTIEKKPQETKTESCRKKSPLRIQNDWTEHISSKGLIYYYNCRTEVSQWQKPNEWTLLPMAQDEIKRILNSKPRNGDTNTIKRIFPSTLSQNIIKSPKRIKFNIQEEKHIVCDNNNYSNFPKNEALKCSKIISSDCNFTYANNNKNKHTEANFNNDDMDISPSSSPMSRGSHSDDCDLKKQTFFDFETPIFKSQSVTKPISKCVKTCTSGTLDKLQVSPTLTEFTSILQRSAPYRWSHTVSNNHKYQDNGSTPTLTQYQVSLATILRSTLSLLQLRSPDNRYDNCLSVAHISELLTHFEAVLSNGGTVNNYRSHRLQTQLLQNSSYGHCNDPKSVGKLSSNIGQIKELVKYLQDFIQDNYPNSMSTMTPVSPIYSKTIRIPYYLQILQNLVETCLMQLCPLSVTSPSSTSSPGSLKDNNSTNSLATPATQHNSADHNNKSDLESPTKRDKAESDRARSVLFDRDMVRFVTGDLGTSYRNQLADCYVHEAQGEYYKFVRLHSVLYPELACESKKLKALVRISEINTELFKHKKEDIERLVHMLECRRLPSHLTRDHLANG